MPVYFIRKNKAPTGLIKIGFTRKMEARLEQLNREIDGGVFVVATCEGGAALERCFHRKLAEHRVDGEWFSPVPAVFDAIKRANGSVQSDDPLTRDRVLPEDEMSEDIRVETRFYLNELVKREWRGYGDSVEGARDRVLDRIGVHRSQGKLIFHKLHTVKTISADVYRLLSLTYCETLYDENRAEDRHMGILRATHNIHEISRREGQTPPGKGYFAPWARFRAAGEIEEANADRKRAAQSGESHSTLD